MLRATVQDILERIRRLSSEDRDLLAIRLAEQAESAWKAEAQSARRTATRKGLNQGTIDHAIHKRRYCT